MQRRALGSRAVAPFLSVAAVGHVLVPDYSAVACLVRRDG